MENKEIFLKLVNEHDAEFILKLRMNNDLSKYLSATDSSIENQIKWIKEYKKREKKKKEFYFVVYDKKSKQKVGVVRLYNIDYETKILTFGSFIMDEIHPHYAALDTMILVMEYSFENLGMKKVILDVRIKNDHAKHFYQRFGFVKTGNDKIDEFYELTSENFNALYEKKYYTYM
jgi:RimJ/RimL family protein N-acetyltransferase